VAAGRDMHATDASTARNGFAMIWPGVIA